MSKRFMPEFTDEELALIEEVWGGSNDYRKLSRKETAAFDKLRSRKIIDYNSVAVGDDHLEYAWWITPHGEMLLTLRQTLLEMKRD